MEIFGKRIKIHPTTLFLAILLAIKFGIDLAVIFNLPVLYWNDSYTRLAYRDQIILGRWLPALQLIIFASSSISRSLIPIRLILSFVSLIGLLSTFAYTRLLFGAKTGLIGVALLSSQLMYMALSTVPYREVLFLSVLFFYLYAMERREKLQWLVAAVILLSFASTVRYEAWLFIGLFTAEMVFDAIDKRFTRKQATRTIFSIAALSIFPVFWYLSGHFVILEQEKTVIDRIIQGSVLEYVEAFWYFSRWQIRSEVIIGLVIGYGVVLHNRSTRLSALRPLAMVGTSFLLISVLGPWADDNLRNTYLTFALSIPFAANGLRVASEYLAYHIKTKPELILVPALIFSFLSGNAQGINFILGAATENEYLGTYLVAQDSNFDATKKLLLIGNNSVDPYVFSTFADYPIGNIYEIAPSTLPTTIEKFTAIELANQNIGGILLLHECIPNMNQIACQFFEDLALNGNLPGANGYQYFNLEKP